MHYRIEQSLVPEMQAEESLSATPGNSARLETIHELVRSGDYHIPASAIADRIIERIMIDKRGGEP